MELVKNLETDLVASARRVLATEAAALQALAGNIPADLLNAVDAILKSRGRVVVSGIGGLGQIVGVTSAVGSFPAMVKVLVGGYTVFGMVSFMLVFGGMERLYRHMGMGGGAGVSGARGGVGNMLKSKGQSLAAAGQSAGNAGTAAAGRGLSALGRFVGR